MTEYIRLEVADFMAEIDVDANGDEKYFNYPAPDSLTEAKMRLANVADKNIGMFYGPGGKLGYREQEYNEALAAVRNHPDYKGTP